MALSHKSLYSYVSAPAPRYLLRLAVLSRLFRKYIRGRDKKFLEIGPGMGDVSACLLDHPATGGGMVLDASEKAVAIIRDRMSDRKNLRIRRGDTLQDADGNFDYILSFEVLEHLEQDEQFMRDMHSRLEPGGLWFISVPAYMKKWQKQDEFSGHVRRYEEPEMRDKLEGAGFEVLELVDYGFPLTSLMRPLRDRYYRSGGAGDKDSRRARTLDSGTEHRAFAGRKPWTMLVFLAPFILLQRLFSPLRLGDGFIVVARKTD